MSAHLRILSARLPRPLFLPRTLCISSPLCLSSPLCISTPLISTPLCPAPPRHVACLRHIRKYTADTSKDPNDAPRAPTSTIEKVATRGKRKTIETEAETSARAGRRSRPTTPRPPSPLRNLLNTSIPILATLEQRILRAKENSTTFANIPYPYNPLSRDELTAVCAPLLDPSFSLPDHLPALSSRIITLVSPFKGSDVLLEYLATALAHHTNADFLKITNADLFHRLPSYISATAHVIDANDRPNFPVNQIPFPPGASAIVSAFRRLDRNSSPGGAPILINVSGGDEPDPTMSGGVPFPWRRVYNQGWSPRDGVFRSNIPIGSQQPSVNQGKQHPVTVMSEVFDEFLHTASEAGDRPKIIYYSDLMELLVLNDTREQLLHSLAAPLLYTKHPIVIIAPSTTTLPTHQLASPRANDNARLGPVIRLAAPFSEDEDDQDDESDPPGQDGSGLLDAAKLSYTHSPATGYVGVPVISFLPPQTPSARHALQPLLNRDRRRVVAETNLREIQAVCEASGVTFASENGGSIGSILDDRSLTRYDRIEALVAGTSAKLLEDRTLTPLEVERVIVVAAAATRRRGEGEVKVEPNLKAKAKVKAKADENGNGAPEPRWEVSMVDLARACEIVIGSAAARAVAQTNATAVPGGTGDGMEASAPPQRLSGREQKMMKQCLVGARE
ncbi:hypothetical protein BC938DRAFT_480842 [Jimgerdemannia flammicorona]|uniref:Uncharacterized protein n=1 Tax=Jimgerdemannia flammicorona TaxID=994334 RepID=A0A433QX54_9FUNG|nr:hypothetical protein BC938DRAFT_480842 [Jimgerdemannia flammicorona]